MHSQAIGFGTNPVNRKKFNGIEHDNDFDLNIDEAFYRNYDPQIGRWWQVDPKVEEGQESLSPYNSMSDNPVRYDDPKGDCAICDAIVDAGKQVLAATAGAANAWASDQLLGAGHVDNINGTGASYGTQVAYIVGNKIGHVAAIVTGAVEDVVAGGGELASVGIATPLAVPLAVHGTSVIVTAGMNLIKGSPSPSGGKPSSPGKMQQEVYKKQAPKDVKRVDPAHNPNEGGKPHVHYKDGTSSNNDGTVHDAGQGTPNPSNKVIDWLNGHNWIPPGTPPATPPPTPAPVVKPAS